MKRVISIFLICIIMILKPINMLIANAVSDNLVPTVVTINGSVMVEAENSCLNAALFTQIDDVSASGGEAIIAKGVYTSPVPTSTTTGAEFNVTVDVTDRYYVWVYNCSTSVGNDSIYTALDYSTYNYGELKVGGAGVYTWSKVFDTVANLTAGTTHNIRFHPREQGAKIDKILVTTSSMAPVEPGTPETSLPSTYPSPSITPPVAHPRVLFTALDIPDIKTNMGGTKSKNDQALSVHTANLSKSFSMPTGNYYNGLALSYIESWAFEYAVNGTEAQGQKAVDAILAYLPVMDFSNQNADITRAFGHAVFTASEVYDWCYPLLTEAQKTAIRINCENIAKSMEINYPPNGQGAVSGHGGEAQLQRDLLSFGIATYNERPDIYNYVAGRYLSQFIQPRSYWYASNTQHQGNAYGPYRFMWDMWGDILFYKMSGVKVLSNQAEFVPYEWIYERRPDGQLFRDGDDYNEPNAVLGQYWNNLERPLFYAAAAFENPYTRWQIERTDTAAYQHFNYVNDTLTPVQFLILNRPDAVVKNPLGNLPLSKYFASPVGMMVARTGWDDACSNANSSDDVVVMMKIGEVWGGNHQHLDAGNFQIYYKGILASESGQYYNYGNAHDNNYNKQTIAHNSILVYDPAESMGSVANSGGQRTPGAEPLTMESWITDTNAYKTGRVIDHAIDPGGTATIPPKYTYVKGDITSAYTSKVSEVLRFMLFMPLDDPNYPAAFFVMDKVTASNSAFKKTWLLHTQESPMIDGNTTTIVRTKQKNGATYYDGRMHLQTLLPYGASIISVGGSGHEFDVNGVNYPDFAGSGTANEPGWGRVEVSPATLNTTDYFLNVMCVSDNSKNLSKLPAQLIETNIVAGAKLSNRVALFGKSKGHLNEPIQFTVPGTETMGLEIFIAGVVEGRWNIYNGSVLTATADVASGEGTLYFEGGAGEYTILPAIDAGNVNGDGIVDISDVIMAAEIAVGGAGYTPEQKIKANVSSKTDNVVDISDVVLIAERAVGGTQSFPVELP